MSVNSTLDESILKFSSISVLQQNKEGNIISANQACTAMLGYTSNELKKKKFSELIHPEDQKKYATSIRNLLSDQENSISTEIKLIRKPGKGTIWIRLNSNVYKNYDQKTESVLHILEDITEQKKYEAELYQISDLLQRMQKISGLVYFEHSLKTQTSFWSDEAFEILEIDKKTTKPSQKLIFSMIHPDDRPEFEKAQQKLFNENEEISHTFRIVMPDGRIKYLREQVYLTYSDSGKPENICGIVQDITSQMMNLLALEESEHKYRTLVESASEGIIVAQNGIIKFANNVILKIIGFTPNELFGKPFIDFIVPEDRIDVANYHQQRMQGLDKILNYETRVINKNGNTVPIEIKSSPYYFNGQVATLAFISDITESKKAKEKLLQLQFGIDNSQIGVFQINDEGIIEYTNQYAFKSLGYEIDELLGKNIIDIDPTFSLQTWKKHRKEIKEMRFSTFETIHRRKDGYEFPVEITVNYLKYADKEISFSFSKDITQRNEILQALKTSEAQLSNAMEIAKLGYWEYNAAENLFIFNDQFYAIYHTKAEKEGGYTMSPDKYAKRFLHPDDQFYVAEGIKTALETADTNYSRQLEHRIIYADGGIGYIIVKFFIVKDSSGKTIKTYGANQDITHQKLIEKELVSAKEKAEESDRLKSAFLANMSHEIRTPMNGIIGFSKLLVRDNISSDKRSNYSKIISESCKMLQQIVDDILDISKIEAGHVKVEEEKVNVNILIDELYTFHQHIISEKKLSLTIHKSLNFADSVIKTDKTRLYQILNNLLNNAIKFTHSGCIDFGYERVENELQFFVRDTGIGIAYELHDKIFESFRQGELELSRSYGGTGLGLAISKKLVNLLGGKIWLESEPNKEKGSTFYFTIPYRKYIP